MDLRRVGVVVGLVLLLVVDAAVVGWALWPRSSPAGAKSVPTVSTSSTAGASPKATPSSSASPSTSPAANDGAVPLTTFVVAASSDEAWVATVGSCAKPGAVAVTADGGETWSSHRAPGSVTRTKPSSGAQGFVIGGDASCALRLWTTADSGASWSDPGPAAKGWARTADVATSVHTPKDKVVRPCGETEVVDLSADGGSRATVLCAAGLIRVTTDAGDSWADVVTRKGALALSGRSDGTGVVAVADAKCKGTLVQPYAGTQLGKGDCVTDAEPVSGRTSVSTTGRTIWLLAGNAVWLTKSIGDDWKSAGSVG